MPAHNSRRVLDDVLRKLTADEEAARPVPEASPPVAHRRLCVGMACFDDFDGVWFTVEALRLYHPEVADDVSFLVVDNHPESAVSHDLKALDGKIPNFRYVPFRGYRSTAVRDLVFREADADIVCCIDPHVLLQRGALAAILRYFDEHPESKDLIQGPLLSDGSQTATATHMTPTWSEGMFGQWALDPRIENDDEVFDIPLQGLGLFACRKDAWVGLNPRFRGFGGEEGYLHEKFRQHGGRTLCHRDVGWLHRFSRPNVAASYQLTWEDRVRNYRFGWEELGWDVAPIVDHFQRFLDATPGADSRVILEQTELQVANPLSFFDGIFCINLDSARDRWADATTRFRSLGLGWGRVERLPAVATPENHHRGCALSWRQLVATAAHREYRNVLGLEDDAIFLGNTLDVLSQAVGELDGLDWDLCYLGGTVWGATLPFVPGSSVLQRCTTVTSTHAVAVNARAFERLLDELPPDGPAFDEWLAEHVAIDQYLNRRIREGVFDAVIVSPRVATQPALQFHADGDAELAAFYTI